MFTKNVTKFVRNVEFGLSLTLVLRILNRFLCQLDVDKSMFFSKGVCVCVFGDHVLVSKHHHATFCFSLFILPLPFSILVAFLLALNVLLILLLLLLP